MRRDLNIKESGISPGSFILFRVSYLGRIDNRAFLLNLWINKF